jgi:hypothetical protein
MNVKLSMRNAAAESFDEEQLPVVGEDEITGSWIAGDTRGTCPVGRMELDEEVSIRPLRTWKGSCLT